MTTDVSMPLWVFIALWFSVGVAITLIYYIVKDARRL